MEEEFPDKIVDGSEEAKVKFGRPRDEECDINNTNPDLCSTTHGKTSSNDDDSVCLGSPTHGGDLVWGIDSLVRLIGELHFTTDAIPPKLGSNSYLCCSQKISHIRRVRLADGWDVGSTHLKKEVTTSCWDFDRSDGRCSFAQ